ncbi:MAG TPA: aldo/keto reductase [Opitutales bacterium]|jgi:L-glyceraldehyde 3-phosphate reductase|nr:aldo/keto reductase [Opitutales bacterium]
MPYLADSKRYENMPYARCGRSGLKLPRLSLGLWHNFGDHDDRHWAREVVLGAFDRGITHFDLANNYGPPPGSAEVNFGKLLHADLAAYRDELIISTKAGYTMWSGPYGDWGSRKYMLSSLDQSLRRLHLDYVDIFYSHRPDPETPLEETMGALAHAVRAGKALYVGLSNYGPEQTAAAAKLLREMGAPCLIHQPRYNIIDRKPENGLFAVLEREGIGCIPFSPLAQGILTDRYLEGVPTGSRATRNLFLKTETVERHRPMVQKLVALAQARGQTLAQMALAWVLRQPAVTSVLPGASSVRQIESNLAALANTKFTSAELAAIDSAVAGVDAAKAGPPI